MKKKLVSISLAAALLLSSLSTAGMSVFASEADAPTTASTTASTTVDYKSLISNIAGKFEEEIEKEVAKEVVSQIADKVVSQLLSTTTTTASTTTTTTAATTTATEADTTTATSSTSATSATTATTATSEVAATTTTASSKDVVKNVIKKLISRKYTPVTVSKKEITIAKGHHDMIKATGQGHISYFSADKSIATVDKDGIVKGISAGQTKIRVIAWGNAEYHPSMTSVDVTVKNSMWDVLFGR